jgi:large subunit ribosomal protein L21
MGEIRMMTEPETLPVSDAEETSTETAPISATTAPAAKPKGYAIIETGGKQYRVSVGDRITVERLASDAGGAITIDRVLMVANDGGTQIGTPVVAGASVVATVDDHFRGEKLIVFKYKPKKRYRRKIGHRQELSHLTITAINA